MSEEVEGCFFLYVMCYTKDSNSCFSDSKGTDQLNHTKKLMETSIPSLIFRKIASSDITKCSLKKSGQAICHSEPVLCYFCGFHQIPLLQISHPLRSQSTCLGSGEP